MRLFKTKVYTLAGNGLHEHKVAPSERQFELIRRAYPNRTLLNTMELDEATLLVVNGDRREHGEEDIPTSMHAMLMTKKKATPSPRPRRRSP